MSNFRCLSWHCQFWTKAQLRPKLTRSTFTSINNVPFLYYWVHNISKGIYCFIFLTEKYYKSDELVNFVPKKYTFGFYLIKATHTINWHTFLKFYDYIFKFGQNMSKKWTIWSWQKLHMFIRKYERVLLCCFWRKGSRRR